MKWFEGRRVPRWVAGAVYPFALPAAHVVAPWALSLMTVRHGWSDGKPGPWNLLGVIPVIVGAVIVTWAIAAHFGAAPEGWPIEITPSYPTPAYLLRKGPYRHSRNPIYLGEGALWAGWTIFYGSLALFGVFVAASVLLGPAVMRREERGLEVRFGEAYRAYKRETPRWVGKARL